MSQTSNNTVASERLKLTIYEGFTNQLMWMVQRQFHNLNEDDDLTAEDRHLLKEYYLDHFISERAKAMLKKHFPEDFADISENHAPPNPKNRPATP